MPKCEWCGMEPAHEYELEPARIVQGRVRQKRVAWACATHIERFERQAAEREEAKRRAREEKKQAKGDQ